MVSGIIAIDLHGKNTYQAKVIIDSQLRRASAGTYRIRIIHGYHGGTALRDFIRSEYNRHPKIKRMLSSPDGGTTELILREY